MIRIGEFSKMGKTTIKTLRYYDKIGILKPEEVDESNGYRMYTTKQLLLLHKIQSYRQVGLSMEEIKSALQDNNSNEIFSKRKEELLAENEKIKNQLLQLEFILQGKEDLLMNYSATLKETEKCYVYGTRLNLKEHKELMEKVPLIGKKVMGKYPKLKCKSLEYCFIRYLDGEYREKDINVEFLEAVEKMEEDFDDIFFKEIEGIKVLSIMHKGKYSHLPKAYAFGMKWVEENGYKLNGNLRENYIDGIWNKEREEDWLTEIQIPIEKI